MTAATLTFTPEHARLRTELRAWLDDHAPPPLPRDYEARVKTLVEWQQQLFAAGFTGLSWPAEYGGRELGLAGEAVLAEELARSGRPEIINRLALYTWAPTLLEWGTPEQRRRYLPGMLDASEIWCQGFSEPAAGSDLAAVRTTADRSGDELVLNGQKVWTSRASFAKWNGVLVRTDREAQRHHGLSMVIVDMDSPGITVRPLRQVTHEPDFSEVFFDEVRVPLEAVLGHLGDGWRVAMSAMSYERGLYMLERQIRLRRRLDELAQWLETRAPGRHAAELGRLFALFEILGAQIYRSLAEQAAGILAPGATSVDKLLLTEAYQGLYEMAVDLGGVEATDIDDTWAEDLLESRGVSIYSGTTQIQRTIVARRLLGLGVAQ